MTEATNTKLMDTEAGGEQTQYEGQKTFTQPAPKSVGQLGDPAQSTTAPTDAQTAQEKAARGEKTAENIRYGQNMSESGMGGMTKGMGGEAGQEGGFGRVEAKEVDLKNSRREQGYSAGGNDVGA